MAPLLTLLVGCLDYSFRHQADVADDLDSDGSRAGPSATVDHNDTLVDTAEPPLDETVPKADAPVYAHTAGQLFTVDPDDGTATLVGDFIDADGAHPDVVDIAIDLEGRLIGGTLDARLVAIDPTTAELTDLCSTTVSMFALAFTSGGTLVAAGADVVDVINVDSCETFRLVQGGYETSGDLVGLPDGYLYWTVENDDHTDSLARLDPSTGEAELVGPTGHENLFGLGYHDGSLFGFSSEGQIVRISPASASTTLMLDDGTKWWGATTNPVVW